MRRIAADTREMLRSRLGRRSEALPFAEAIVAQLEGRPEEELAEHLAGILLACGSPAGAGRGEVAALASDPELLASFFQNVDLLYGARHAHADAVSGLTMEALHEATRGAEEGA